MSDSEVDLDMDFEMDDEISLGTTSSDSDSDQDDGEVGEIEGSEDNRGTVGTNSAQSQTPAPQAYQHEPDPPARAPPVEGDDEGDDAAGHRAGANIDVSRLDPANIRNWYV